jgi:hypothetical protein
MEIDIRILLRNQRVLGRICGQWTSWWVAGLLARANHAEGPWAGMELENMLFCRFAKQNGNKEINK